jgi:signal transduction histidine kinase
VRKRALRTRIGNLVGRRRTSLRLAARERKLEETVEDLRLKERAMDAAPVGITIAATDVADEGDNSIVYANDEFESLTGYGSEMFGADCRFLQGEDTDPETTATVREAIEEAMENAAKHNDDPEPCVEVRAERESGEWIAVEVADDGPGIPDHETRVLEQGETSLTHADRLGVWLIYWVVAKAGGEFSVDTSSEGTTVRLAVPAHP